MSRRCVPNVLLVILVVVLPAAAQDGQLWVGPNVNMVSGTTFPDGDPFLQRQNEPSIAVSTRNTMHLVGFANDYRAVDIPGLPEGKETGDAWLGVFKSLDGGLTWRSTLLPGYPQDPHQTLPLWGYDAGADPVVRAGTHGLFYLSYIVFDRGDFARSGVYVTRYMDLNNKEGGDPIEYIDTRRVESNEIGDYFIDKPWMAVDIPRSGAETVQLEVYQDGSPVYQNVQCGNVYLAWAEIWGLPPNRRSRIMFSYSTDCGGNWSTPQELSDPDTLNQGVTLAVSPTAGDVWVAWRQFETNPTYLSCAFGGGYWKNRPAEWPLEFIEMGEVTHSKAEAIEILDRSKGGDATYILAKQLIPAKLNMAFSMAGGELMDLIIAADAWLVENPLGSKPKGEVRDEGVFIKNQLEAYNEGLLLPEGCTSSILNPGTGNAIVSLRIDGATLIPGPPTVVAPVHPLEQGTSPISFRTNAYPTITVDNLNPDRVYVAWTTRGEATPRSDIIEGDGRIVVSTSVDGTEWTIPNAIPIDRPEVPGHQLEPSMSFAAGKVLLTYIDLRYDHSGIFERFIADWPSLENFRHTVDLRAAAANPDATPSFTDYSLTSPPLPQVPAPVLPSDQVSRYVFIPYPAEPDLPDPDVVALLQFQFNPPNLPIFVGGTRPFLGDYIDIAASPPFLPDGEGGWRYNSEPGDGGVYHVAWTDNRDVEAPHDGNWANYIPPSSPSSNPGGPSLFDPNQTVPACDPNTSDVGQTRIRDQNTYTARISRGLYLASPGGSRPSDSVQRSMVVFLRNDTQEDRVFRLNIVDSEEASFDQFSPLDQLEVEIPGFSSASRTAFVRSHVAMPSIRVEVREIPFIGGEPDPDGLSSAMYLNPDPTNPPPADPTLDTGEVYNLAMMNPAMMNLAMMNPAMMNPAMMNQALYSLAMMNPAMMNLAMMNLAMMNPAMMNQAMMNLAMMNPAMMNPAMMNQAVYSLAMMNPAMMNPAMMNLAMMNPAMMNLAMMNPAMMNGTLTDFTWEVRHEGNATAAYSVNMVMDEPPEGLVYQLLVYKLYTTPVADGCELVEEAQHQMLVNVMDPSVLSGSLFDPETDDPGAGNTTFWMEPGDLVYVTLRVIDPDSEDDEVFNPLELTAAVVAHGVNTEDAALGLTQQPFAVPDASIPMPYTMTTGRVEHAMTVLADGRVLVTGGFNSVGAENSAEIYDPATGQFEATGDMSEARSFHTSTILDDGRVLIVGAPADDVGWSAEIFDPVTGTFALTIGDLIQPREGHTATKLADGRVLITGGSHIGGLILNSAEIYDPLSDTFSLLLNTMSQARLEHTATLMNNGRVLITGGSGNTAEVFNPAIGGGTFTPAIGLMSDSRRYHSATLLPDGKVLIAGGFSDLGPQVSLVSADIYDPATNALSPAANMVDGHAAHIAELLPNGKVLVAGGSESPGGIVVFTPTVELYDWQAGTFSHVGALSEARTQHAAARLPSGDVLITGGTTPGPPIILGTNTFELYHPGLPSKMLQGENLGTARTYHTATLLPNGVVMVAGGGELGNHPSNTISVDRVELFDPLTNTFSTATPLPTAREFHTATLLTDGRVLLAGGIENLAGGGGAGILNTAVLYSPFSDSYSAPITMTSHRYWHEATILSDGRVLITGGRNASNTPTSSAEIYDPLTNTFHDVPGGMSVERYVHRATLLPDGRVLVTGGSPNLPETHQTAEIWDPAMGGPFGGFDPPITMVSARQIHSAILMPDGRVLLSGGMFDTFPYIQDSVEIFDPSDDSFTASAARLTAARRSHTSTLLPNGKVLLVGGSKLAPAPGSAHVFGVVDIYDPATDTMTGADPLSVPRSLHTATALHDGRVLITGGWEIYDGLSNLAPTKSVEIYDPFDDVVGFFNTGSMNTARYAPGAILLLNGEVLVAGGAQVSTPFPDLLTVAELYDPISGTFRPTGDLNLPRYGYAQARLHDGRVLVAGGLENGAPGPGEIYDPNTGLFTVTSGSTNAGLACTATLLPNGRVLIAGTAATCTSGAANAELFDPLSGMFLPVIGAPITRRAGHTATILPTGKVLIAGGFSCASELASAELYDPLTDSFSPSGDVMSTPRIWHTATLLPSGKVLIVGGQENSFGGTLASGEIYDPLTDSFTPVVDVMAVARENHTATLLANGKVLIAGGIEDDEGPWSSAEIYDPWANSFSPAGDMNSNRVNHYAIPLWNGKVFIGAGWDGNSEVATAELYVSGLQ